MTPWASLREGPGSGGAWAEQLGAGSGARNVLCVPAYVWVSLLTHLLLILWERSLNRNKIQRQVLACRLKPV